RARSTAPRSEPASPGGVVSAGVPARLRARPTLVLQLQNANANEQQIELSYLTAGLGWKADYVAELAADEKTVDLSGWVTLTNTSGTAYKDAKLQLVAGNVNQVQPAMEREAKTMMAGAAAPQPAMAQEQRVGQHR